MNKRFSLVLASICLLLYACRRDDDGQTKKEELKKIILDYYSALSAKDLEKANSFTTSSFLFFDEGRIYNNQLAIDSVKKMSAFTATFTIDSLNVHVDKKDASAYYFRHADFVFEDGRQIPVNFLESCTFNKEGNKWKLRFLHSSIRK